MNGKVLESDGLSWKIDKKIGSGGFGSVYSATSQDDEARVAIKFIPKSKGARRELLFEDLSEAKNVIKIIATGEYSNKYFIVMELASESLRSSLAKVLSQEESIKVIHDIAEALDSIQNSVVHRDIKPDNILLSGNVWCLSDFGIARFIEQTTSTETFKHAHSAPYTAPERWRGERASSASDVYSLGVTAYEILEGNLPFAKGDFSEMHQNSPIPPFSKTTDHRIAKLISDMLSKTQQMRPTPQRIIEVIDSIVSKNNQSSTSSSLQDASRILSTLRQQDEAIAEKRRLEEQARTKFIAEAKAKVTSELKVLMNYLIDNAAEGKVEENPYRPFFSGGDNWKFTLGNAQIMIDAPRVGSETYREDFIFLPFDVVAYSTIRLVIGGEIVRSHSVWFSDMMNKNDYGCYEVAFMDIFRTTHNHQPFALGPSDNEVDTAFRPIMGGFQLGINPIRIEDNQEYFISKWANYLADAAQNRYQMPSNMPEQTITNTPRKS